MDRDTDALVEKVARAIFAQHNETYTSGGPLRWENDPEHWRRYARAALSILPPTTSAGQGELVDPQPEIVGDPICKIVSYNHAHETAVELGYRSITEALEALSEYPARVKELEEVLSQAGGQWRTFKGSYLHVQSAWPTKGIDAMQALNKLLPNSCERRAALSPSPTEQEIQP